MPSPSRPLAPSARFGARALTLGGTSLIAVAFGLGRYGYGLFVPQFAADLRLGSAEIGAVSGLSYVGYALGLLACPRLVRRRGARCPALAAAALATTGITAIACAQTASVFAIGVTVTGVGVGLAWPPFSELAADHVSPDRRPRVLSTISTGTAGGLILAVPLALIAGSHWRIVWLVFGALAALVLLLNFVLLPRPDSGLRVRPTRAERSHPSPGVRWLGSYAAVYGATGATFFTFAIDLAHQSHHDERSCVLLWAIVGATGLVAVHTGDVSDRLGLGTVVCVLMLGIASGLLCIGLMPGSLVALDLGAALFGPAFMAGAAVIPRWAAQLQPAAPAHAHSMATVASAAGSVAGAAGVGAVASATGLPVIFIAAAALAAICALTISRRTPTDR